MIIEATSMKKLHGIRHAFFTRHGGVSEGIYRSLNGGLGSRDAVENTQENRVRMAQALGVTPSNLVSAFQIHSPDVIVAERPWTRADAPRVDAIVTRVPGLAIGVTTADCGPILFADETAQVIGAAHAGWKGALTGVLEATVDAMGKLGATRAGIQAAIGPLIRQDSYEVGPEFVPRFRNVSSENIRFFKPSPKDGHSLFDLPGYIAARLAAIGIAQIDDLKVCTYSDPERFFSYRRSVHRAEPDYGRHVNAIVLQAGG